MGHALWAEGRGGAKPGSVGAGVPCRGQEGAAVQALNTHPELWGCRQPGRTGHVSRGREPQPPRAPGVGDSRGTSLLVERTAHP